MSKLAQHETGSDLPFLVCSTGRIGRTLPMDKIKSGITAASKILGVDPTSSANAADAILTSDTERKVATAQFQYQNKTGV